MGGFLVNSFLALVEGIPSLICCYWYPDTIVVVDDDDDGSEGVSFYEFKVLSVVGHLFFDDSLCFDHTICHSIVYKSTYKS